MRIIRLVAAASAATILAVLAGGPALAHNSLVEAVPKKDAVLKKAPAEVRLTFLQKLDARFTTIVVTDAAKQKVPTGEPEAEGKTGTITFTGELPNGDYTVAYRVVSSDGHPVQGAYSFTLADPTAVAPSPAAVPTTSTPAVVAESVTELDEGSAWWPFAAVFVVVVLLGMGAVVGLRRCGARK
ncbi:MAG: copper resistance CopC family protein [Actinoplanes sp.]